MPRARSDAADVVHTHLVHADVLGALVRGGRALVSTKHNDDPFRIGPFRFVERAITRRAARVICITEALRRFNVERVGLPPEKLVVVPYGLDEPPVAWGPNELELPEGKLVVAVSRLVPQKGLDVAVEAMAGIDATLVVLGEGPERERLEALAREHGVRLLLPGRVGDVAAILRRADLLVHPARWEGFGLALLEAMLCGLPVVATRVSSIPEIVLDGETGVLVPPDDSRALAAALAARPRRPGRRSAPEASPELAPSSPSPRWPTARSRPTRMPQQQPESANLVRDARPLETPLRGRRLGTSEWLHGHAWGQSPDEAREDMPMEGRSRPVVAFTPESVPADARSAGTDMSGGQTPDMARTDTAGVRPRTCLQRTRPGLEPDHAAVSAAAC